MIESKVPDAISTPLAAPPEADRAQGGSQVVQPIPGDARARPFGRLELRIPPALLSRMQAEAYARGESLSSLVRLAIRKFLKV